MFTQTLQVSRISRETHAFCGIFMVSRRETSFLTHFGKIMKICPIAISQEPEEPQKSMTYQNASTKCKEFNYGIGFSQEWPKAHHLEIAFSKISWERTPRPPTCHVITCHFGQLRETTSWSWTRDAFFDASPSLIFWIFLWTYNKSAKPQPRNRATHKSHSCPFSELGVSGLLQQIVQITSQTIDIGVQQGCIGRSNTKNGM